jgi:Leucine-rich repeat (LRR) protein
MLARVIALFPKPAPDFYKLESRTRKVLNYARLALAGAALLLRTGGILMPSSNPSVNVRNHGWLYANDTDATMVFVHGVLSNSRSAWLYRVKNKEVYWPDLIRSDQRFQDISIFLGGFSTGISAGPYGLRRCADEVFLALNTIDSQNRRPPMEKNKIIFVCHSLGGIVTRYLLTEHYADFAGKTVGLFLIASPSGGSHYANAFQRISETYQHQQGKELGWRSPELVDLDARFRRLLDDRRIPNLYGLELCEHHGPLRFGFLPFRTPPIVTEDSAGRYFGPVQMIAGSDHSSICKPRDLDDEVYSHLVAFVIKRKLLPSDDPLPMLNEYETARSIEAMDGMIQWLRTSPTAGREEAFRAIHRAALETQKYVGDRREGLARNRETEKRLADLWFAVADCVGTYDAMLAGLCRLKGHGWADERVWDSPAFRDRPLELTKLIELVMNRKEAGGSIEAIPDAPQIHRSPSEAGLVPSVRRITDEASARIIESAVRRKLDIPRGALREDELAGITELDLSGMEISDLTWLRKLTGLTTLDLSNCAALQDLGPLADLPQLTFLNLASDPGIDTLDPLSGLKQLTALNLADCIGVYALDALAGFDALQSLQLSGATWIHDLAPLARLDELRWLAMDRCPGISDLGPLERLHRLTELYLQGSTSIVDLAPLSYLTNLESLDLTACTQIKDIGPLWRLTRLTYLGLRECPKITDFTALAGFTRLPSLNLNDCTGLSNLEAVGKLSNLSLLYLCRCPEITDLKPLGALSKLVSLALNGCTKVSDLTPLAGLPSLQVLDLRGCSGITSIPDSLRIKPHLDITAPEEQFL